MKTALQETELDRLLASLGGETRIDYSLERFRAALEEVGHPERDVHSLVIGGTNGKGSTTLLVSSALSEAGFRIATYLSPHLQSPRERFLLDLEPIPESQLVELARELIPTGHRHGLSYFEFLTLIFFVWARRSKVDFVVLEVGLGGRLDATNVTDPLAFALTNVSWDHMDFLGDSLEAILAEKLGCLRPESLLFTGVREPELTARIEAHCNDIDSIYYYSHELKREPGAVDWSGQTFTVNGYPFRVSNPSPGAVDNVALAFLLLRIVFPRIPIETVQRAFARARNPGRFEIVSESPRVIVSGDHNPAGIDDLLGTLKRLRPERLRIVCGFSPDKPYESMYRRLGECTDDITLTVAPRARGSYRDEYFRMGPFEPAPERAVETALKRCDRGDTLLVTGSLYLAGAARRLWKPDVGFHA